MLRLGVSKQLDHLSAASSWIFVIIVLHVEMRLSSLPYVAYETISSTVWGEHRKYSFWLELLASVPGLSALSLFTPSMSWAIAIE